MKIIRDWLNGGQNYAMGVQLYLEYGKDDTLRSLFQNEGETAFKRDKLFRALEELWTAHEQSFTQIGEEKLIQPKKADNPATEKGLSGKWKSDTADPVLITLKEKWKKAYSEMKNLKARLLDIATNEERCAAAHRILDLDDLCDEIYAKRDYYEEFGRLPEDSQPDMVGDPVKWPVKLANAKRYVRDYRNKLKKEPGNERYAAKLKKYQDEIYFYEEKLKMHAD